MEDWNVRNDYGWQQDGQRNQQMGTGYETHHCYQEEEQHVRTEDGWPEQAGPGNTWGNQENNQAEENTHWRHSWMDLPGWPSPVVTPVVQGVVVEHRSRGTEVWMETSKPAQEAQSLERGKGPQSDHERIAQLEGIMQDLKKTHQETQDKGGQKPGKGKAHEGEST